MTSNDGYTIICNARTGKGINTLALVDRKKTKRLWWTSDDVCLAICYESYRAARFACSRLRYNHPRVVPFKEAAATLRRQAEDRMAMERQWEHEEGCAAMEAGWDGHKNTF